MKLGHIDPDPKNDDDSPKMQRDRSLSRLLAMNRRLETEVKFCIDVIWRFVIVLQLAFHSLFNSFSEIWSCAPAVPTESLMCPMSNVQ